MVDEYLDILAGGEWITGHSGEIFEVRNPADRDDLIAIFARGDAVDVDEAVQAAKKAYPSWMRTPRGTAAPRDDEERQDQHRLERDHPVATDLTAVVDRHRPAFGRVEAVRPSERLLVAECPPPDRRAPVAVERLAPQHQSGTGRRGRRG